MTHLLMISALFLLAGCVQVSFPGNNYRQVLPPITEAEQAISSRLRAHVVMLAERIGERNIPGHPKALRQASQYIQKEMTQLGYTPQIHPYQVANEKVENISVEILGGSHPKEIVVIGAHYDSVTGSPGANDNGTGVAAVLELTRMLKESKPHRTIRFVFFVNEEPPYFQTDAMGSLVYAKECRARKDQVVAMISMETIGCYSDANNSQHYPGPFGMIYPNKGNFIFVIGDINSRGLTSDAVQSFRRFAQFPSEGAAVPGSIEGVGWSDHWSFWQAGYRGIMVTDTAPFRYAFYHTKHDRPDKIDFDRTARVVEGFAGVVSDLAGSAK